jgi:hypothetical protein
MSTNMLVMLLASGFSKRLQGMWGANEISKFRSTRGRALLHGLHHTTCLIEIAPFDVCVCITSMHFPWLKAKQKKHVRKGKQHREMCLVHTKAYTHYDEN